ncbi:MAG: hypothetical protein ACXW2E_00645 [Nitrososphaeraceae archaeon]
MRCNLEDPDCCCPFAFTNKSEYVQGLGCLPSPYDIIQMRTVHGKTWACHSDPTSPCIGAIDYMKEHNMPYKVIDPELLTEASDWHNYC